MERQTHAVLGIVFLTVFLDIVGFSVLFPLFPAMLEHYLALEGQESALGRLVARLDDLAGGDHNAVPALFGGVLGSIYGILQFLFATVWGAISDRIGRRRTLLVTLSGTVLGYVLWVFAGSFAVLVASRVLCGIMAGNISIASAAVADVTAGKDRAKGMGFVGMAIGLGFVLGPAIGGVCSVVPSIGTGAGGAWSLNPFSVPALASLALAVLNVAWAALRFPETLPEERRGAVRSAHGLALKGLGAVDAPGILKVNLVYLLYLVAFAGVEFTLTFLVAERLAFTIGQIAWMFTFAGLIIALVQGGLVRRLVPRFGEKRVALAGICLTLPSFQVIGGTASISRLYAGLALMAAGSALVMPSLSALCSRYAPPQHQGLALGGFRSMGSLARAIGPILGSVLYWRFGAGSPYFIGALWLLAPLALGLLLPPVADELSPQGRTGEAS